MKSLKLATFISLLSCATQSADQYLKPFDIGKYKKIRIEVCINRAGYSASRDIASEATESRKEKNNRIRPICDKSKQWTDVKL